MISDERRIQVLTGALEDVLELFDEDEEGYYIETLDGALAQVGEEAETRIARAQSVLYNEIDEELFVNDDEEADES